MRVVAIGPGLARCASRDERGGGLRLVNLGVVMPTNLLKRTRDFLVSEDGPTATEYAVMLALIIMVCLGAITGIGQTVDTIFTNVDAGLPTGTAS